jgi:hypothetical protein
MRIFYGAGHEQFTPRDLLRHARRVEDAGEIGIVRPARGDATRAGGLRACWGRLFAGVSAG